MTAICDVLEISPKLPVNLENCRFSTSIVRAGFSSEVPVVL